MAYNQLPLEDILPLINSLRELDRDIDNLDDKVIQAMGDLHEWDPDDLVAIKYFTDSRITVHVFEFLYQAGEWTDALERVTNHTGPVYLPEHPAGVIALVKQVAALAKRYEAQDRALLDMLEPMDQWSPDDLRSLLKKYRLPISATRLIICMTLHNQGA